MGGARRIYRWVCGGQVTGAGWDARIGAAPGETEPKVCDVAISLVGSFGLFGWVGGR